MQPDPFIDFWETFGVKFRPTAYGRRRMHGAERVPSEITVFAHQRYHAVQAPLASRTYGTNRYFSV